MNVGVVTVAVSWLLTMPEALASNSRPANLGAFWQSRCLFEKDLLAFTGLLISEDEVFLNDWQGGGVTSPGTLSVTRQCFPRVFDTFGNEGSPIRHLGDAESVAALATGSCGMQQNNREVFYVYRF